MAIAEKAVEMFHKGFYMDCMEILKMPSPSCCPILTWVHTNNRTACQHKIKPTEDDGKVLEQVLFEMQGLPLNARSLSCEAAVVTNLLIIHARNLPSGLYTHAGGLVDSFLQREWLGVHSAGDGWQETIVELISRKLLQLNFPQGLNSFLALIVTYASTLLLCSQVIQCEKLLQKLLEVFRGTDKVTSYDASIIILEHGTVNFLDGEKESCLCNICQILLSLCHIKRRKYAESQSVMGDIGQMRFEGGKLCAAIITGYLNGQAGVNTESMFPVYESIMDKEITRQDKSALHLMLGHTFAKQSKYQCAVQQYKQALQADFSNMAALYSIALQYQKLEKYDAEIETLGLLLTAIEESSEEQEEVCLSLGSLTRRVTGLHITRHQALYTLAHRCMHTQRFDTAASRFQTLLNLPPEPSTNSPLSPPSQQQLYEDTAYCFLQLRDFQQCISLCDTLIKKQYLKPVPYQSSEQSTIKRKKRRRESQEEVEEVEGRSLKAYMYKSDALLETGELKKALSTLDKLISFLQDAITINTESSPSAKKARIHSEVTATGAKDTGGGGGLTGTEHLVEAYHKKACLLEKLGDKPGTLHYSRLVLQLKPGDGCAMQQHTRALIGLGQGAVGAVAWLSHRHIDHRMDAFHIATLLRKKRMEAESSLSKEEREQLLLDVTCLEHLLKK